MDERKSVKRVRMKEKQDFILEKSAGGKDCCYANAVAFLSMLADCFCCGPSIYFVIGS